jgi:hypothetical protein
MTAVHSHAAVLVYESGLQCRSRVSGRHAFARDPIPKRLVVDPAHSRERLQGEAPSFMPDPNCASAIVSLFLAGRPSAIIRSIVSINVNSIQRHSARHLSHVGEEAFEIAPPPLAHANAPAAIVAIPRFTGITASALSALPCMVRPANSAWARETMRGIGLCGALRLKTPATVRSRSEIGTSDPSFCPAITAAQPFDLSRSYTTKSDQTPITQAGSVDKSRHLFRLRKYDCAVNMGEATP